MELGDAVLADQALGADDPVLRGLKERYREELADAFRAALAALGPKERALLRYQLMDGLSIDDIGVILRVHRATAARRIARVRDALVADTRARLAEAAAPGRRRGAEHHPPGPERARCQHASGISGPASGRCNASAAATAAATVAVPRHRR